LRVPRQTGRTAARGRRLRLEDARHPPKAVSEGADIARPVRILLEELDLLGTKEQSESADGFAAVFTGPPQSVALIEAGATAATKWWATGLGASVIAAWGSVAQWRPEQGASVKVTVLGGAAVVTAALVLSIAYSIASDVRGRAAAAVSTIEARAKLATTMVQSAQIVYEATPETSLPEIVPLPSPLHAKNSARPAKDEDGWRAVALERDSDGKITYILVKGSAEARVSASELRFQA